MMLDSGINTFYPIYSPEPISQISGARRISVDTPALDGVTKTECQACKERKYIDVSNDSTVSFQSPTHIDPASSAAVVMSHEKEHMSNAISEGKEEGKELISSNISLQVSVCHECGRSYVSGGTTTSTIATTYNQSNPYDMLRKSMEGFSLAGSYVDTVA